MTFEAVGGIILGWLLGLLSPIVVNAIQKRRSEGEVRAGILTELKDVRLRLASAVGAIQRHCGTIDRALLKWLMQILEANADSEERSELEAYQEIAKLNDVELLALFQKERADRALSGLNLKKYRVPYLDSKIGELGIFDEKTRAAILDVRAQLELFNADVEQTLNFQKMTFEVEDPDNLARVMRNIEKFSRGLAGKGRYLADKIGLIT